MTTQCLPVCFYPTTLCILDDDANLVSVLKSSFEEFMRVHGDTSARRLIKYLNEYQPHPFTDYCIESIKHFKMEERDLHIETRNIHKVLFNPERFNEISTIMVDHTMPEMTGTEFLRQIQHIKCSKAMLTGEADDTQGIEAFNEGLIDRFYQKGEDGIEYKFFGYLQYLQIKYFQSLSEVIVHSLTKAEAPPPQCILDAGLIDPLFKILNDKNIVEYYLVSNEGYFLTVSKTGKLEWLIINSADELDTLHGLISDLHDEFPCKNTEVLVKGLKDCTKTLFFIDEKDSNTDPQDWTEEFILSTEKISTGKTDYYYAFAPFNPEKFPIEEIVPFMEDDE